MSFDLINPPELGEPRGWTHGMLGPAGGRVLLVAGQDASVPSSGVVETDDFVDQFGLALTKAVRVVEAAGGGVSDIGRLTIYVTDMAEYRAARKALGPAYRSVMGRHFPAMALVEVSALVDERARVEIEATAVLEPTLSPRRA